MSSFDDSPDQANIPGLKEKALNPAQKKALAALKNLAEVRQENKEARKKLRDVEEEALLEALEAIDALGLQVGKVGPACFEATLVRKLRLKLLREMRSDS